MKKFRDFQPDQMVLLPTCLTSWLPDDHPVHFISEVVEKLDLTLIYNGYRDLRGQPPYNPTMMVKVLIYAMTKGIHSSRKIEKALHEDVGMRVLSGNQQPDHWTLSEFRKRHHHALGELFVQTVQLADKAGLVKLTHVATDGTKIKANASKHKAMSYGRMVKEEERLRKEVKEILTKMDQTDRKEDKRYGSRRGDELPEELSTRKKRLAAIEKAKAELEEEARQKLRNEQAKRREVAEKQGKKYTPQKEEQDAKPKDKDQRNFTDSESRIMKDSNKAFIQGYNAQATVDAETHIIVGAELSNIAGDSPHLVNQIEEVEKNTGRKPKNALSDAGYYSEDNLSALMKKGINPYIPPGKITHNEWRTTVAPRGRIPKTANEKYLMWRKLRTKPGRKIYKLRQTSVEPVFGFIKEQMHLRQFLLRGQEKASSTWRFACAVHNLLKLFRAGVVLETGPMMGV